MIKSKLLEYRADLLLLSVAIAWGATFLMVQDVIKNVGVYSFLFWRFLLSTILIYIIFSNKIKSFDKSSAVNGMILGLFLFAGFATQTFGLAYTKSSIVAFITGLNVIIVPFASYIIFKGHVRKMVFISSIIALMGLYFLTMSAELSLGFGEALSFICAFMFALHILFTGRFSGKNDVFVLVFFQFLTVTILSMIFSISLEDITFNVNFDYTFIKAILVTAVFATVYAFMIQTYMQQYTTPTKTAIIFTMEPVSAAIFGYFMINEILTPMQMFGAVLIISATLIAEINFKKT
ncbi:DMT family transporter [Sulfurimonas sp.]|uniref:DMT family transporter n=1 Tax=Sulfurimonas sp. TaxID=2022749 RepID=UPI0025F5ECB1|nr:DMT family transporter [Sulfurimonas sp.]